jgi:hypothetical protein
MQIKGKVLFKNLGAGIWLIQDEAGNDWQPINLPKKFQQANLQIVCDMEEVQGGVSVFMAGKMVKVKNVSAV